MLIMADNQFIACPICDDIISSEHLSLCCDECKNWFHDFCLDLCYQEVEHFATSPSTWICPSCTVKDADPFVMRTRADVTKYQGPKPRRSLRTDRMAFSPSTQNTANSPEQRRRSTNVHNPKYSKFGEESEESALEDRVEYSPECSLQSSPNIGWRIESTKYSESSSPSFHNSSSGGESPKSEGKIKNKANKNKKITQNDNSQHGKIMFFIFAVVCVVIAVTFSTSSEPVKPLTKEGLTKEIIHIINEFPSQSESIWPQLSSGIKDVDGNPSHPSVFLLLHDSEEETPTCLAQKISKLAMRFLNATNQELLVLEGEKLGKDKRLLEDYGVLISDKKHEVEEHRSMIIKDLHKVPGQVARSFHSFCDVETPLVDKAVYLFTMKASGANSFVDKPTMFAERVLKDIWGKQLKIDILMPLIVRITNNVLIVRPEDNITSCQI